MTQENAPRQRPRTYEDYIRSRGYDYQQYADGGMVQSQGGQDLLGMLAGHAQQTPGKGRDDDVPAMLSEGEYVIPADVVSMIGDGNTEAGYAALDKLIEQIRMNGKGHTRKPTDGQALGAPKNATKQQGPRPPQGPRSNIS